MDPRGWVLESRQGPVLYDLASQLNGKDVSIWVLEMLAVKRRVVLRAGMLGGLG